MRSRTGKWKCSAVFSLLNHKAASSTMDCIYSSAGSRPLKRVSTHFFGDHEMDIGNGNGGLEEKAQPVPGRSFTNPISTS